MFYLIFETTFSCTSCLHFALHFNQPHTSPLYILRICNWLPWVWSSHSKWVHRLQFCHVTPFSLIQVYRHFVLSWCLHHQGRQTSPLLIKNAAGSTETSIHFLQTTRRHIPQDDLQYFLFHFAPDCNHSGVSPKNCYWFELGSLSQDPLSASQQR